MKYIPTPLMPIESAAECYGVSLACLVNAGAHQRLRVFAPVMNAGVYTWPNDLAAVAFPRLDKPFRHVFGVRDRILLHPNSLLEIEAMGSTVIDRFAAPDISVELVSEAALLDDAGFVGDVVLAARTTPGLGTFATVVQRHGKAVDPRLEHIVLLQNPARASWKHTCQRGTS
jgi:hypothetical protein